MNEIVFVRHSAPHIDPARPARDWPLSAEGRALTVDLGKRLGPYAGAKVVSSPEVKARETASILHDALEGSTLQEDPDLREHDRANLGFLPRADFERGIAAVFDHPDRLAFGDESGTDVRARFAAALARACPAPGQPLVVVTHGTALTLHLSGLTDIDPIAFWRSLTMPMAMIVEGRSVRVL